MADLAGQALTAAGNIADGDYGALGNQIVSYGVGRLTGARYRALATGPLRNPLTGRFERNIYGGATRRVKEELSSVGAGKLADQTGNAVRCGVK